MASTERQLMLIEEPRLFETDDEGLDALPEALLLLIAMKLDCPKDLCSLEAVNKYCRMISSDNTIWKKLCCEKFGAPTSAKPPSWKELYRFNHQFLYGVIFARRFGRPLQLSNGMQFFVHI